MDKVVIVFSRDTQWATLTLEHYDEWGNRTHALVRPPERVNDSPLLSLAADAHLDAFPTLLEPF